MNIEALEAALVSKQDISGANASEVSGSNKAASAKEASASGGYSWLNELTALISGGTDLSSTLYGSTSGLDFTRSNDGWRSGKFSFLNTISQDAISNTTVCSRYSKSSALDGSLQGKYTSALSGMVSTLKSQLSEAKNQLAKLEAEKKAKEIELNSGYDSSTGRRLNSRSREALQNTIAGYERQISMQKATISDLETKIDVAES